jgi:DNA-directed RNA polymerase subunit K/omega
MTEQKTYSGLEGKGGTELSPPIEGRFLFVDVAARRALQLKRGARVRLASEDGRHLPHKLERAAMEEVRRRLIEYTVPELPVTRPEQ